MLGGKAVGDCFARCRELQPWNGCLVSLLVLTYGLWKTVVDSLDITKSETEVLC